MRSSVMIILSSPLWLCSWHLADNTKPCFYSFTQLLLISSWTLQVSQLIRVRYRYLFVWVLTPKCILMFSLRFKLRFHSVEKDKTWQNKYNKYKTNILDNRQVWVGSHIGTTRSPRQKDIRLAEPSCHRLLDFLASLFLLYHRNILFLDGITRLTTKKRLIPSEKWF